MKWDLIFLVIILLFAVLGYLKGFLREIISIVGIVLATLLTNPFALKILKSLKLESLPFAYPFFVAGVWFLLVYVFAIFGRIASDFFKPGKKGKILGAILGFSKGTFFVLLFLWGVDLFYVFTDFKKPDVLKKSKFNWVASRTNLIRKTRKIREFETLKRISSILKLKDEANLDELEKVLKKSGLKKSELMDVLKNQKMIEGKFNEAIKKLEEVSR